VPVMYSIGTGCFSVPGSSHSAPATGAMAAKRCDNSMPMRKLIEAPLEKPVA